MNPADILIVRHTGRIGFDPAWHAMRDFSERRTSSTPDELWLLEHPPVFTQGRRGRTEHLLDPGDIPLVETDRGGQVTYHGPGQLIAYTLIDIGRRALGVREFVTHLEETVRTVLAGFGIASGTRCDAPGVYVDGAKLASVGLRIRRGSSFHGMALNVDADLEPFSRINPCGFRGLEMTDLKKLGIPLDLEEASDRFLPHFLEHLGLS